MERLLFKVVERASGHEFKIYDNGRIEGFSSDACVSNYFPFLSLQDSIVRASAPPTSNIVPLNDGASVAVALSGARKAEKNAAAAGEK